MDVETPPHLDRRVAAFVGVGALSVSNVLANRVLPERGYVAWNASMAAGLVGLARAAGVAWRDLGLGRAALRRGLAVGVTAAGVVAVGHAVAASTGDHDALHDHRVLELPREAVRHQALVRIPLGTVVLEEVAFRGVLPALLPSPGGRRWVAESVSALLFGLWHILPSRELVAGNEAARRLASRVGPARVRSLVVGASAAAGWGLHGGALAAPMLAHWAVNALGVVAAHLVARATARAEDQPRGSRAT